TATSCGAARIDCERANPGRRSARASRANRGRGTIPRGSGRTRWGAGRRQARHPGPGRDWGGAASGADTAAGRAWRRGWERRAAGLRDGEGGGGRPPMDRNSHGQAVMEWARRLAGADSVAAWIEDYSYQGREIVGMALRAPAPGRVWSPAKLALLKPTALIVARHHANEISSTNAAFQIAWLCANDPGWAEIPKALNVMLL